MASALHFLPHKRGAHQRPGAGPSEWGTHFCLLHPLAPVGAIAVRGLLGSLAGAEGHCAGLLGLELEWG